MKMRAMSGTCPIQMMKMKPPIMATVLYVRTRNLRKLSACVLKPRNYIELLYLMRTPLFFSLGSSSAGHALRLFRD